MPRRGSKEFQRLSVESVGLFDEMNSCKSESDFQEIQKQYLEVQFRLHGIKHPCFPSIADFKDDIAKRLRALGGPMMAMRDANSSNRSCQDNEKNLESIRWYVDRIDRTVRELGLPIDDEFTIAASNAKNALSQLITSLSREG